MPFGRCLLTFELFSDVQGRLGEYRTFLSDWMKSPSPLAEERQIGLALGVETQFFANGIVAVGTSADSVVVTFLQDSGEGRIVGIPEVEARALVHLIELNRRTGWVPDDLVSSEPPKLHEKGRDYVVRRIDIFAYDPTSQAAFLTYEAESERFVQINMSTATAIRLQLELFRALSLGRDAEKARAEKDADDAGPPDNSAE